MVMLCDIDCAYDLAAAAADDVVVMDGGGGSPLLLVIADPKRVGRPDGDGMVRGEEMWDMVL
jgi:hypothetical protein